MDEVMATQRSDAVLHSSLVGMRCVHRLRVRFFVDVDPASLAVWLHDSCGQAHPQTA